MKAGDRAVGRRESAVSPGMVEPGSLSANAGAVRSM